MTSKNSKRFDDVRPGEALPELAAFASAFKYAGIVAGALLLFAGFELAIRR